MKVSMSMKPVINVLSGLLPLTLLLAVTTSHAQNLEDLKKGVVKVTAQSDGKIKVGTGFIVRLEKDAAYIVTASHVIEGDPQPKVVFRGQESKSVLAQVKGKKGGDPRGLAVLVVVGDVPQSVEALPASSDVEMNGGEEVTVIGFPRTPAVPWAVTPGVVTGQEGEYLVFSGAAAEGNSGGPVLWNGKVVGVVTEVLSQYGYAVPMPILRLALRGWGVPLEEASKTVKRLPEGKSASDNLPREITGKDGAPMVLVPAGVFTMGSREEDEKAQEDERPAHRVYLDAFYIDQYEVTATRYATFLQKTGRHNWYQDEKEIEQKPVVGVGWDGAAAYCSWAGKRLPTEAEWEKAARGTDQRLYPWGNAHPAGTFRGLFGGLANYGSFAFGSSALSNIGSFVSGKSPYNVYDMAGNASEWVADWYEKYHYRGDTRVAAYSQGDLPQNPKGPVTGEKHVYRGGSSASPTADYLRSAARYSDVNQNVNQKLIGFRCAHDAK